jgi:hypothetical protein
MGGMNPLTVKFQVVFLKFSVFLLGHLAQKEVGTKLLVFLGAPQHLPFELL